MTAFHRGDLLAIVCFKISSFCTISPAAPLLPTRFDIEWTIHYARAGRTDGGMTLKKRSFLSPATNREIQEKNFHFLGLDQEFCYLSRNFSI